MDFYLFEMNPGGRAVHFPVAPEQITVRADTQVQTFNVLNLGEISLPRGRNATRYSWSGLLLGQARMGQPMSEAGQIRVLAVSSTDGSRSKCCPRATCSGSSTGSGSTCPTAIRRCTIWAATTTG